MNHNKIIKSILLFFVFVLLVGVVFLGKQLFYNSVGNLLIRNSNIFSGSLEASINDAAASVESPATLLNTRISATRIDFANSQNLLPYRDWQVKDLKIKAEAAISVEVGSGKTKILFKKNEEKKLPMASLAKLMTALVVLKQYNLNQKITISESAMLQEGEQGDLKLGQVLSVKNLLYIALIESSNRAAYALSEVVGTDKFVELMNSDAQKMGLINTHFEDSTGLNQKSYSTAEDLFLLSKYLFENYPLFKEIVNLKEYDLYLDDGTFHHKLINTNKLLGDSDIIGGKTGWTDSAKGCFMVIQDSPATSRPGDYLINIVLGAEDRFAEMKNMISWINAAYRW